VLTAMEVYILNVFLNCNFLTYFVNLFVSVKKEEFALIVGGVSG